MVESGSRMVLFPSELRSHARCARRCGAAITQSAWTTMIFRRSSAPVQRAGGASMEPGSRLKCRPPTVRCMNSATRIRSKRGLVKRWSAAPYGLAIGKMFMENPCFIRDRRLEELPSRTLPDSSNAKVSSLDRLPDEHFCTSRFARRTRDPALRVHRRLQKLTAFRPERPLARAMARPELGLNRGPTPCRESMNASCRSRCCSSTTATYPCSYLDDQRSRFPRSPRRRT